MKPIKPMLAKSCDEDNIELIAKKQRSTVAEIKYDGFRIQIHAGKNIRMYSRNLIEIDNELFPEIISSARSLPDGVWDGEILGQGTRREGHSAIKKRFSSAYSKDLIEQFPLNVRVFDCMMFGKKNIMNLPLDSRREYIERNVSEGEIKKAERFEVAGANEISDVYEKVLSMGLEGIVCKDSQGIYIPDGRGDEWLKVKKFDSYDLVVLGLYKGEGKLSELPFAAVVVGTMNENGNYETITKVGLTDSSAVNEVYEILQGKLLETAPENAVFSEELKKLSWKRKVPFAYINPEESVVLEIEAQDISRSRNWHSCGLDNDGFAYSLKIPKVAGIRYDKSSSDCTKTSQIREIYDE